MAFEADAEVILKTIFLLVIATANLVGNSCVCLVIFKDKDLRCAPRNSAVASLAISDLLVLEVIFLRIFTYYGIGTSPTDKGCGIAVRLFPALIYVSFLHLSVLSLDRYLAIVYPLRYRSLVTRKRLASVLVCAWFFPILSVEIVPLLMGSTEGYKFTASFIGCSVSDELEPSPGFLTRVSLGISLYFALPVCFMFVSYVRICKEAWRQAVRVHSLEFGGNLAHGARPRRRDMKWAKTIGIVTGAFLLCFLPMMVVVVIRAKSTPSPTIEQALQVASFLTYTNTALNPIIYSLRSQRYRNAFRKIFYTWRRQPRPRPCPRPAPGELQSST